MNMNTPLYSQMALAQQSMTAAELAALFPACKFFLPCNEVTGAVSLTERMSGALFTRTTGFTVTNNADGTLSLSALPNVYSGAFTTIGTKLPLLMLGSKNSADVEIFKIGDPTASSGEPGIRIGNGVATTKLSRIGDGTTTLPGPTVTPMAGDGATFITRSLFVRAWNTAAPNGLDALEYKSGTLNEDTGVATTGVTTMGAFSGAFSFGTDGGGVNKLGFIQLWHFTTLPSDQLLKAAAMWTNERARLSPFNKALFPGFAGLT